MANYKRKKEIIEDICKVMDILDPTGKNGKRYRQELTALNESAFTKWMTGLKNGQRRLAIVAPNLTNNIKMEHAVKACDTVGVEMFHRLWLYDPISQRKFLTTEKYPVMRLPVRRQEQFLEKKIRVPDSDRTIDGMTGQVTGDDRSSGISNPEIQILFSRGLKTTLTELIKVRGGDIPAYGEFKRQLEEGGFAQLALLPQDTRTRVSVVTSALLSSMHLENNL